MVAFEGHSVTSLGPYNHVVEKREDSMDSMRTLLKESRKKLAELTKTTKSVDFASSRLSSQYEKAVGEVSETYNFYLSMLGEKRMEMIKELEKFYSSKQVQLSIFGQKCQESQEGIGEILQQQTSSTFHIWTKVSGKSGRSGADGQLYGEAGEHGQSSGYFDVPVLYGEQTGSLLRWPPQVRHVKLLPAGIHLQLPSNPGRS